MYKWNLVEIKLKKLITLLLKNHESYEIFKSLNNIYNPKKTTKSDILLDNDATSFGESYDIYFQNHELLPEELYNIFLDLYLTIEDENIFDDELRFSKNDLTEKELIDITKDIILSIKSQDLTNHTEKLFKSNELNIQTSTQVNKDCYNLITGLTLHDPLFKKTYINLYRSSTILDVVTLTHEIMHHYLFQTQININHTNYDYYMFSELEGEFGDLYAINYLIKNGLEEANLIHAYYINNIYLKSYLLMISHILFQTASSHDFNLNAANAYLDTITDRLKVQITDLSQHLNISLIDESVYILGSLMAIDLLNMPIDSKDMVKKIINIKSSQNSIMTILDKNGFTFHYDDCVNLQKEYKKRIILAK